MPVGAARGVRLSGARVPHGGRALAAVAVRGHGSSLSVRGAWLSGARAPHGGRTWGERVTVDVLGRVSSLSPHHCTGGRLGRPSPLPSCCRGRIRGLGSWVDRAACWFVSDGGGPGR